MRLAPALCKPYKAEFSRPLKTNAGLSTGFSKSGTRPTFLHFKEHQGHAEYFQSNTVTQANAASLGEEPAQQDLSTGSLGRAHSLYSAPILFWLTWEQFRQKLAMSNPRPEIRRIFLTGNTSKILKWLSNKQNYRVKTAPAVLFVRDTSTSQQQGIGPNGHEDPPRVADTWDTPVGL